MGGAVPPLCIGGEARGCLEAVPSSELPALFPAVLEHTYLLRLCFREPDRGPATIATAKFADLPPCGGPSACKTSAFDFADRTATVFSSNRLDPTKEKPRDSYDNVGRGSTTPQGSWLWQEGRRRDPHTTQWQHGGDRNANYAGMGEECAREAFLDRCTYVKTHNADTPKNDGQAG